MNFGSEESPGKVPGNMEELIELSLNRIKFTLGDPVIRKVRRLLTMEQFRNPVIAKLNTRHSIDGIQGLYKRIFAVMIENGTIKNNDPEFLSVIFTAPISLLIQLYDREPERENEVMKRIEDFFRKFAEEYAVKG